RGADGEPARGEQAGRGSPDRPELTGCPGDEDRSGIGHATSLPFAEPSPRDASTASPTTCCSTGSAAGGYAGIASKTVLFLSASVRGCVRNVGSATSRNLLRSHRPRSVRPEQATLPWGRPLAKGLT